MTTQAQHDAASAARGYRAISDYGLIGDCRTAALVASDASIDWCCLPHFDSDAVLSRILGAPTGGYLAISSTDASAPPMPISQRYLADTAILETEIGLPDGRLRVTDFMPTEHLRALTAADTSPYVVRRISAVAGTCRFVIRLKVAFKYARATTRATIHDSATIIAGGNGVVVFGIVPSASEEVFLEPGDHGAVAGQVTLRAGDAVTCVLGWAPDAAQARNEVRSLKRDWSQELDSTRAYWQNWASATTYHGPYRDAVVRSAITLKLLTFAHTGAMVAAPTTSLPEVIGGHRNWDYRYTWIRDGSFAAGALASLGHLDEAAAFIRWVVNYACRSDPMLHPMYTLVGTRDLPEMEIGALEGYRASTPVRVGNGAVEQRQLDIQGEWLDCVATIFLRADAPAPDDRLAAIVATAVTHICDLWAEPDLGIWEIRADPQHFVYSKVLCWAALDRGIKLAERYGWPEDLARWQRTRDAIHAQICARGINSATGAFAIAYESQALDAATLMIPLVGFLPPTDPRVVATTTEIMRHLTDPHGLVYRYRGFEDGVGGNEGTFTMCSFWLAENLAMQKRRAEALALFEQLLAYVSPTGLLSEMIDSEAHMLLGNYPQAFSHIGLIRTALALASETP